MSFSIFFENSCPLLWHDAHSRFLAHITCTVREHFSRARDFHAAELRESYRGLTIINSAIHRRPGSKQGGNGMVHRFSVLGGGVARGYDLPGDR